MGFLKGPLTYKSFRVKDAGIRQFGPAQVKTLERFAISKLSTSDTEQADIGFLAGSHLSGCYADCGSRE